MVTSKFFPAHVPREISGSETVATFRRSERRVVRSRVVCFQKCTHSVAETEHVRTRLDRNLEYSVISPRPFRVLVASRARRRTLFDRAAGAFSPEPGNQGLIRLGRNRRLTAGRLCFVPITSDHALAAGETRNNRARLARRDEGRASRLILPPLAGSRRSRRTLASLERRFFEVYRDLRPF